MRGGRVGAGAAVDHLGKKFAFDVWKRAAKGKPGRPKGRKEPDLDDLLLKLYDDMVARKDDKGRKSAPRAVAEIAKRLGAELFPATVGAIEQRVRRLLKARERSHAARAEADRKFAAAMLAGVMPFGFAGLEVLQRAVSGNALASPSNGASLPSADADKK